mgnify:CR=1 FL=1
MSFEEEVGLTDEGRASGCDVSEDEVVVVEGTRSGTGWPDGKESVYNRIEIRNSIATAAMCLYRLLDRPMLRGVYMMPPQPTPYVSATSQQQRGGSVKGQGKERRQRHGRDNKQQSRPMSIGPASGPPSLTCQG